MDGRDVVLKGKIDDRIAKTSDFGDARQPQMIADCDKTDLELRTLGVEGESLDLMVAALGRQLLTIE